MATIAKIKCGSCDRVFDYYFHLRDSNYGKFVCPYCLAIMDKDTGHALRDVTHL